MKTTADIMRQTPAETKAALYRAAARFHRKHGALPGHVETLEREADLLLENDVHRSADADGSITYNSTPHALYPNITNLEYQRDRLSPSPTEGTE